MVKIIDSIMGSGKSTWAINFMKKQDSDKSILYIAPYLDEAERIRKRTMPQKFFHTPKPVDGSKLKHIEELLRNGEDVATTHELFRRFNDNCKEGVRENNYILILDETITAVEQFHFKGKDDALYLLENHDIRIAPDGLIEWTGKKNYDTLYNEIRILTENHCLFRLDDKFYMWQFPTEIFSLFKEVYVMTYLFEGSLMKYYFDLHKIEYERYSIDENADGEYQLADYHEADKTKYQPLINLYRGTDLNNNFMQKKTNLSANWFKSRYNEPSINKIRNNLYNYVRHKVNVKSGDVMWTTFKDAKMKLKSKGYSNGFVEINCRARNDYKDRHTLMYVVNRYVNPEIVKFFEARNITIDQDAYALSEMLQWIWRSAIRDGEEINLFIQSDRMRKLLIDWLQ